MSLSPDDVEDIVKLLDSTTYDELDLETARFALRLRRGPGGWTQEQEARAKPHLIGHHPGDEADTTGAAGAAGAGATGATGDVAHDAAREGLHAVPAPLPGVFYRAPKPGEPPFVEVGDHVEQDTVVAILETMKLMNPVRAGAAGTVAEIAVANNESTEQGAVLMWLTPDAPGERG